MKKITALLILLALAFFSVAGLTAVGQVQKVISFQDPLNEMGFFLVASSMGIMVMVAAFESDKGKSKTPTMGSADHRRQTFKSMNHQFRI
jgi:uncharacterized membrane protein